MSITQRLITVENSLSLLINSLDTIIYNINTITSPGQITDYLAINVRTTGNDILANPLEPGNVTDFATPSAALAWVEDHILRANVDILIDDGVYNDSISYSGIEGSRITIKALNPVSNTAPYNPPVVDTDTDIYKTNLSNMFNVTLIPPIATKGIEVNGGSELSIGGIYIDCGINNNSIGIEIINSKVTFIDDMLVNSSNGYSFKFTNSKINQIITGTELISLGALSKDILVEDNTEFNFKNSNVVMLNGLGTGTSFDKSDSTINNLISISTVSRDISVLNLSTVRINNIDINKSGDGTGETNIKVDKASTLLVSDTVCNSITLGSIEVLNKSIFISDTCSLIGITGYVLEASFNSNINIVNSVVISEPTGINGASNGAYASDGSNVYINSGNIDVTANALEATNASKITNKANIITGDILSNNGSDIFTTSSPNTNSPLINTVDNNNSQILSI